MKKTLDLYAGFFVQSLKARMAYKADFFGEIFASMLGTVSGLVFVFLLFHRVPDLAGWRRDEVFLIYGLSLIPFGLFNVISVNLYEFADRYIVEGRFDRLLLRPMPTLAQLLMEKSRITAVQEIALGTGIVVWASMRLGIAWGPLDIAWAVALVLSGAVIYTSIFVILSSFSFFFEDRIGIGAPVWNLIMFGRFPVPIFGPWIGAVLSWVIPFAFVSFYPATHFLGRGGFRNLCYATPVVALVAAALAMGIWTFGVRGYRSTGS